MATGGYKLVRFSWQGGRSDTPLERTKYVLNGICDAIVNANVGWQYDTLTQTANDFITMPAYNNNTYPNLLKVLKLEYNNHIYKMGVGYNYKYDYDDVQRMKVSDCSASTYSYACIQRGNFGGGLYFGIVKDGDFNTDSTYGLVWNETGCFLRWMPFNNQANTYNDSFFISENSYSYLYTYYFLLKNAQIAIMSRSSKWTTGAKLKCIVAGEIFKETAHSSDNNTFGSFYLSNSYQREAEAPSENPRFGINAGVGYSGYSWPTYDACVQNQIFTSTGEVRFGYYSTQETTNNYVYRTAVGFDTNVVGNRVSPIVTSPGGRWTPCYMLVQASDQNTYGIVQGDGFKAYIDTDLLRGVNPYYTYGQLLGNNSEFIYLGGGFAIGWDASNTVPLF